MSDNWGTLKFTDLNNRLDRISQMIGQLAELQAKEALEKLERLKLVCEKAQKIKDRKK